ncbi:hypothetical protein ATANTOWER_025341 [Ataeniobius toweri]|uniref:Uncharacterized protein n=1 Tax=Ataeniobius toweri TaxID=208326 RepID=A0ABU7BL49_9TELE|nr:hypothetical protein [Ataeniobius toweri]
MAPSRPPNHAGGRMDIKQTNSGTTTQVCKDSKAVVKELTTPTPPLLLLLIRQHPPDTHNTPTPPPQPIPRLPLYPAKPVNMQ